MLDFFVALRAETGFYLRAVNLQAERSASGQVVSSPSGRLAANCPLAVSRSRAWPCAVGARWGGVPLPAAPAAT